MNLVSVGAARLVKLLPMSPPCVVPHARRTVPAVAKGAVEKGHLEESGRDQAAPFALPLAELHGILLLRHLGLLLHEVMRAKYAVTL